MDAIDITQLPPDERLHLLERLWDSLSDSPDAVPVTAAHRAELDRRLDEIDAVEPSGIPWNEVMHALSSRST